MSRNNAIILRGPAQQDDVVLTRDLKYVLSADDIESGRPPHNTADDVVIEVLVC